MNAMLQRILNYFRRKDLKITPEPINEPKPEPPPKGPDGDGWYVRSNGEKFRPVKGGTGWGMFVDDEPSNVGRDRRWNNSDWPK